MNEKTPLADTRIAELLQHDNPERPVLRGELRSLLLEIQLARALACSSEPISAGSMPNNSSGADRDAVIEECAVMAGSYAPYIGQRIRSLKSPPTVG